MSCIQQQSPTPVHGGLPALRINTDIPGLHKASFEEINSAPVTRKELGYQDVGQHHQYSPSVAFTSNNWRSTMAVPPCPPGTNSSTEDPSSPERIFSNEDAFANTSGSSEHRTSPVNQGEGNGLNRGRNGSVSSPIVSEVSSGSTSGGSTGTPPAVTEAASLARLISHGYCTAKTLSEKAPGSMDRVDIFEVLPAALNAEGRAVCQHHKAHGVCDCEAFPLVKISFPSPMSRSNRVCYPIQEVDESLTEPQPVSDAEHTPNVSPRTSVKAREDNEKRKFEAERFKALLGKLKKPAEDKRNNRIEDWEDPAIDRPERFAGWEKGTDLAWARRSNECKDQVYKEHASAHDGPALAREQSEASRTAVPKQPERQIANTSKPSPVEHKLELPKPKLRTAWNPKAKEFSPPKLGDKPADLGPAGKAAGAKARELLAKFVSEAKSRDTGGGSEKKSTNLAGARSSPSPLVPGAANSHHDSFTSPFGVTPSLAQTFPGITPLTLPALTLPDTVLGGLSTPGLGPSKFDFNTFSGLGALNHNLGGAMAGTPGLGTPGFSGLAGVSPGHQRPFSQTLPGAVNAIPPAPSRAPPGPVPKPRLPDAGAQQQYEQWIEWRKANEPGYALECKARQARRAQRTKPTSGPSPKGESRGATNGSGSSTSRSGDSKTE